MFFTSSICCTGFHHHTTWIQHPDCTMPWLCSVTLTWTMDAQRVFCLLLLLCAGFIFLSEELEESGPTKYMQKQHGYYKHSKFLGVRIPFYSNASSTFQLELLSSGDIDPNPGPDNCDNYHKYESNNFNQLKRSFTSIKLHALNIKTSLPRLPKQVWDIISTLQINSSFNTKQRGKRGGRRKPWLTRNNVLPLIREMIIMLLFLTPNR